MITTTTTVKDQVVKPEYFQQVREEMWRNGYQPFSSVEISTNDCEYHVPVTFARETSLFFNRPGRTLIVQMVLGENDSRKKSEVLDNYWDIKIYPEFKSVEKLVEMVYKPLADGSDDWMDDFGSCLGNLALYSKPLQLSGFTDYGNHYQQSYHHDKPPSDPVLVARDLARELRSALDYIEWGKFKELQVTSFWPYYTFPKSNQIFWKRFNGDAFKRIVRRAWGGEPF